MCRCWEQVGPKPATATLHSPRSCKPASPSSHSSNLSFWHSPLDNISWTIKDYIGPLGKHTRTPGAKDSLVPSRRSAWRSGSCHRIGPTSHQAHHRLRRSLLSCGHLLHSTLWVYERQFRSSSEVRKQEACRYHHWTAHVTIICHYYHKDAGQARQCPGVRRRRLYDALCLACDLVSTPSSRPSLRHRHRHGRPDPQGTMASLLRPASHAWRSRHGLLSYAQR